VVIVVEYHTKPSLSHFFFVDIEPSHCLLYFIHLSIPKMSDTSSTKQLAHLHWSSSSTTTTMTMTPTASHHKSNPDEQEQTNGFDGGSCFCGNLPVPLDLSKLHATPETLAAIFGVRNPESIIVVDQDTKQIVPLSLKVVVEASFTPRWNLLPDHHYWVQLLPRTKTTRDDTTHNNDVDDVDHHHDHARVPIRKIFTTLIPGSNDEEKGDRLHNLSNTFYAKIWHDPTTPKDFFDKFYSRFASDEIQAFRQYNWLIEVFGGPSLQDGGDLTYLHSRVMAKHTSSRMTLEHSLTWLRLMKRSMDEEFQDAPALIEALEWYWLHFYAFFPFTEEERKEIRTFIFSGRSL
jgi:truncated hemoglobin YjbI